MCKDLDSIKKKRGKKKKNHLAVTLFLAQILNTATQLRVCPSQRKEKKISAL